MGSVSLYAIWIPLIMAFYFTFAYITTRSSEHGGAWFWALVCMNAFPAWPLVARLYEKDQLTFIAALYDIMIIIAGMLGFLYFTGSWQKLGPINYVGLVTIVAGIAMLKHKVF